MTISYRVLSDSFSTIQPTRYVSLSSVEQAIVDTVIKIKPESGNFLIRASSGSLTNLYHREAGESIRGFRDIVYNFPMVDMFLSTLAHGALFVFIYMTLWYVVALAAKRTDLINVAWGLGFILLTMLILVSYENASVRPILVSLLVFVWGLKVSLRAYFKSDGGAEDSNYRELRAKWGRNFFIWSYLRIFMWRGALLMLIAIPVLYINTFGGGELGFLDYFGAGFWFIGFVFEFVSDRRLSRFFGAPGNKIKYLVEALQWSGIFLMALSLPRGYLAIIGPIVAGLLIKQFKF